MPRKKLSEEEKRARWRENNRRFHAVHPEKRSEYARRFNAAHPKKRSEYSRSYQAAHPEKQREYGRRYYRAHPEKQRERHRINRAGNPEKFWAQALLRKYGLTVENYWAIFKAQGGVCLLCSVHVAKPQKSDHPKSLSPSAPQMSLFRKQE